MKITKVKSILTAPDGIALVVVKVKTDQQGLYGIGWATFTQRPTLVAQPALTVVGLMTVIQAETAVSTDTVATNETEIPSFRIETPLPTPRPARRGRHRVTISHRPAHET